ncbi:MAG TPA: four helix bundle protein [Ignavibacteriaceae bacterium]|nr:four helix bundle protein [Ignavibacteriaceae bacterium]HQJ45146.1 four helix bundle protein [Ignavibacteriaceae bacterium]
MWQLARVIVTEVHNMTLNLPKFEMCEEGSQIRRSSKSTKSNIVEGYGRRIYKNEYIRYIIFALASNNETLDHLENLFETGSLADKVLYDELHNKIEVLGKKLNRFLQTVQIKHLSDKK